MLQQMSDSSPAGLRATVEDLYESERFRMVLLAFDAVTVAAFLVLTFLPQSPWLVAADAVLGTLILVEFAGRAFIAPRRAAFFLRWSSILDMVVIATLLIPPLTGSFAFLRVLRAIRLFRVLRVVRDLRRRHRWIAERGELISSAVNVVVFVFITSAVVYEMQVGRNPEIRHFSDALYFTVTTLTTTGFGDITLVGQTGRLLSVVIMIVGISLFVKLAQSIVRPSKVHVECQACGLSRHDPDAVHCKHCGSIVHIDTEGA
ncbi:potassium channel family protein [Arenibaculum pallidiluteum]|uniref:potassium channel family protein n=1 Tax=Arenibaculum pallidiluteum TaxID=2812559 RepID=UPI001A95A567|nr:potassium channel family protein [Arenibaculum pallidiluteum]